MGASIIYPALWRTGPRAIWCAACLFVTAPMTVTMPTPAQAHPHVFIDGGVDLVFDDETQLTALDVTWLYDEFETLYLLAAHGLSLNDQGGLDEGDRRALQKALSLWPEDFDGSAHMTVNGEAVALAWPSAPQVHLIDGRLRSEFTRALETPLTLRGQNAEIAFYESTYFFAFKITNTPRFIGGAGLCAANVVPFTPDPNDGPLLAKLAQLSREEIPQDENVGALFADRIALSCG